MLDFEEALSSHREGLNKNVKIQVKMIRQNFVFLFECGEFCIFFFIKDILMYYVFYARSILTNHVN